MRIHTRTAGDVRILDISGNIILGQPTSTIRYTVNDLLESGGKKIVLNLSEVGYVDSSGIGELVRTHATVAKAGQNLKLLNLTKKIKEVLVIAKLLTVFDVYENEQAAVDSFA